MSGIADADVVRFASLLQWHNLGVFYVFFPDEQPMKYYKDCFSRKDFHYLTFQINVYPRDEWTHWACVYAMRF